jgi:cytochrome c oxidase assembly protein subunit 11
VNPKAKTALFLVLLVFGMTGLAFASVPLYRIFCQVTGFGGATVRATEAPGAAGGQIGMRFDANIDPALPWRFEPAGRERVRLGERTIVHYTATNLTARPTTGRAIFNVTPAQAGAFFNKIECFCFTEQTLKPGESVKMPVVFFVDPKVREEEATRTIDEITLSYTFYPVESASATR